MNVGVLASGNGSNLQALIDRAHGRGGVVLAGVASDKPGARAIVYYQYDNGPEQMVNMNRDPKDGSFSASLDAQRRFLAGIGQRHKPRARQQRRESDRQGGRKVEQRHTDPVQRGRMLERRRPAFQVVCIPRHDRFLHGIICREHERDPQQERRRQ